MQIEFILPTLIPLSLNYFLLVIDFPKWISNINLKIFSKYKLFVLSPQNIRSDINNDTEETIRKH